MEKTETTMEKRFAITREQLAEWLNNEKELMILDVRPEEERNDWSIPESVHADIYDELKTGHSKSLELMDLPDDRPIITVCGAGNTSLTAARQLREKGLETYSLDGGMKAWNFAWDSAEAEAGDDQRIVQVRRTAKGCLSYVIGSGDEAIVIDASLDPVVYLDLARSNGWDIQYVMDTHLHADYVSRTRELARATGATHLLHRRAGVTYPFTPVSDGQDFMVGDITMKAIHTPGHTPESLTYLIGGTAAFTGDTLFTNGVGRPDLKADEQQAREKAKRLYDSLQRLMELDAGTRIFPAHVSRSIRFGEPVITSTLGELSASLKLLSLPKERFVRKTLNRIPPAPENYQTISRINSTGNREAHRLEELEAGANRCAVG